MSGDLPVHQLSHFGVRADLSISAGVLRIVNAADADLLSSSLLEDGFPSATCKGTVNWAQLISAESHEFLQHEIEFLRIWYRFFRMQ